jgi:hypothetical protein
MNILKHGGFPVCLDPVNHDFKFSVKNLECQQVFRLYQVGMLNESLHSVCAF